MTNFYFVYEGYKSWVNMNSDLGIITADRDRESLFDIVSNDADFVNVTDNSDVIKFLDFYKYDVNADYGTDVYSFLIRECDTDCGEWYPVDDGVGEYYVFVKKEFYDCVIEPFIHHNESGFNLMGVKFEGIMDFDDLLTTFTNVTDSIKKLWDNDVLDVFMSENAECCVLNALSVLNKDHKIFDELMIDHIDYKWSKVEECEYFPEILAYVTLMRRFTREEI